MLDEREPHRLGQNDDGRFAGAIDSDQRFTLTPALARELDDLAGLAPRHHTARHRPAHEQETLDVDRGLAVEARFGDLKERRYVEDRGVVDQDVDAASGASDLFDRRLDRRRGRDVGMNREGSAADLTGEPFGFAFQDVGDRDPGTFLARSDDRWRR